MLQVCADSGYRCVSHSCVKRDSKGLFIQVVNDGEAAIELSCPTSGTVIKLVPWRTDSESENTSSTSQELPLDLVIVISTLQKPPVLLLFDPKYKVAPEGVKKAAAKKTMTKREAATNKMAETLSVVEPMKEDIEDLLRLMDQIRTPEGVREIQYAAILYPGQKKQIASNLEALQARPSDGEALQRNVYEVLRRYLA